MRSTGERSAQDAHNPKTGDEIYFITIDGSQCRLEARNGFSQVRHISNATLNSLVKATWNENKEKSLFCVIVGRLHLRIGINTYHVDFDCRRGRY